MRFKSPVARASMVPVLGIAALVLFSMNFYRFLDLRFFDKLKDIVCDTQAAHVEEAHERHVVVLGAGEHDSEHKFRVRVFRSHDSDDVSVEWRRRDLERSIRQTEREIARTARRLRWQRDHHSGDVEVEIDLDGLELQLENLESQLQVRMEDLESLSRELRIRAEGEPVGGVVMHPEADDARVHVRVMR